MTKKQVLSLLEANKDKRGMAHWRKSGNSQLKSFGLGLTKIKALGRRIGRNHKLALELWNTPIYEAKLLSTVVDKSKEVTPQQVDRQIKDADFWLLSHAYCSNLMPKTPFMKEKAEEWAAGKNALLRRCG